LYARLLQPSTALYHVPSVQGKHYRLAVDMDIHRHIRVWISDLGHTGTVDSSMDM